MSETEMTGHPELREAVERYKRGESLNAAAVNSLVTPDRLEDLLRERDELVKLVMEMRGTLRDLRMHLHAAGRRPEECYEMSMIDDAIHRAVIDEAIKKEVSNG